MISSRPFLAALVLYGCIAWASGTTCSSDDFCTETAYVTSRCDGQNCVCKDATRYKPIPTGCGDKDPHTPYITVGNIRGHYHAPSNSSNVTLTCATTYKEQAKYNWFQKLNNVTEGIPGANGQTYTASVQAPMSDPVTYSCQVVGLGSYTSEKSAEFTISRSETSDSGVQNVVIVPEPQYPLRNSYVLIKCLVYAGSSQNLRYSWTFEGAPISGQHDSTLQINKITSNDAGDYVCSVREDGVAADHASRPTYIRPRDGQSKPYLTPDKINGVETVQYMLTCHTSSSTPGMTFELRDGGTGKRVQTSSSGVFIVTATAVYSTYKCACLFNGTEVESARSVPVQGKDIVMHGIRGPKFWVVGVPATLGCGSVSLKTTSVSYQWFEGAHILTGETGKALTVTNPKAGSTWYICIVTTSRGTKDSRFMSVHVSDSPIAPRVRTSAYPLHLGGRYTLTCDSLTPLATATYKWTKDGVDLPSTSRTYLISSMAAENAGTYNCSITLGNKTVNSSSSLVVDKPGAKGLVCDVDDVTKQQYQGQGDAYTGNCIAGRFECSLGAKLVANGCVSPDPPRVVRNVTDLELGGRYTLTCTSTTSVAAATYRWNKDVHVLPSNSSTYVISSLSAADFGSYTCRITVNGKTSHYAQPLPVQVQGVTTEPPGPGPTGPRPTGTGPGTDPGKACTSYYDCQVGEAYNGKCVSGHCECSPGAHVHGNVCDPNPAVRVSVSLLLLPVTVLAVLVVGLRT